MYMAYLYCIDWADLNMGIVPPPPHFPTFPNKHICKASSVLYTAYRPMRETIKSYMPQFVNDSIAICDANVLKTFVS